MRILIVSAWLPGNSLYGTCHVYSLHTEVVRHVVNDTGEVKSCIEQSENISIMSAGRGKEERMS